MTIFSRILIMQIAWYTIFTCDLVVEKLQWPESPCSMSFWFAIIIDDSD